MKSLTIIAALLIATSAHAGTIATIKNTAGGLIRFTNDQGTCPKDAKFVLTTGSDGTFHTGCWTAIEDMVYVVYSDGQQRIYPMGVLTLVKQPQPARVPRGNSM